MIDCLPTPHGLLRVDDNVTYQPFSGKPRQIRVTAVHFNIKNGRDGFDGLAPTGETVWGYVDQITSITKRERIG